MTPLQMLLVSTPLPPSSSHFVRPLYWYYGLYEIEKYDFIVVLGGITTIPNLIEIRPAVLELNHKD